MENKDSIWDIAWAMFGSDELRELLKMGWEAFAVGGGESLLPTVIWLRKK